METIGRIRRFKIWEVSRSLYVDCWPKVPMSERPSNRRRSSRRRSGGGGGGGGGTGRGRRGVRTPKARTSDALQFEKKLLLLLLLLPLMIPPLRVLPFR